MEKAPFEFGITYVLNPNDGEKEIRAHLQNIREMGFTMIRTFLPWDGVEPADGVFEFGMFDSIHDIAAELGLHILESFSIYPPCWLREKLFEAYNYEQTGRFACLDLPLLQEHAKRYISTIVERYKNHPALYQWSVWNEPAKSPCYCKYTIQSFGEWLRRRYPSKDDVYHAWYAEQNIFCAHNLPDDFENYNSAEIRRVLAPSNKRRNTPLMFDYNRFLMDSLNDNIAFVTNTIKSLDPNHTTQCHTTRPIFNPVSIANNEYAISRIVDAYGITLHYYHCSQMRHEEQSLAFSFSLDRARGWAGDKPVWVTELQAGTSQGMTPSPERLHSELYRTLARNMAGAVLWQYHGWRAGQFEVGEYSLVNPSDGGPTERSKAAGQFGAALADLSGKVSKMTRPAARCAILVSTETNLMQTIRGAKQRDVNRPSRLSPDEHNLAVYGCYKALRLKNYLVDFVCEQQILEGALKDYQVLYMPQVSMIQPPVAKVIADFVQQGGALYADGRAAELTGNIFLKDTIPNCGLSEVFGARETDFIAWEEVEEHKNIMVMDNGDRLTGYWQMQRLAPIGDAKVIGRFADGYPAVITNNFGKGRTMLVGSALCRKNYFESEPAAMQLLVDFAGAPDETAIRLVSPACGVELDYSASDDAAFIVLTNHTGEECDFVLETQWNVADLTMPEQANGNCTAQLASDGKTITGRLGAKNWTSLAMLVRKI